MTDSVVPMQSDREAAAAFGRWFGWLVDECVAIERGECDRAFLVQAFARHAAQARLEAEKVAHDVLGSLAWIQGQAESAMVLASKSDGAAEDLDVLGSITSDIAINADMASDKLTALSTRGDQK